MADKAPTYYEPPVECYCDETDHTVRISLPSDVNLSAEVAEKFGRAIIECAEWSKSHRPS